MYSRGVFEWVYGVCALPSYVYLLVVHRCSSIEARSQNEWKREFCASVIETSPSVRGVENDDEVVGCHDECDARIRPFCHILKWAMRTQLANPKANPAALFYSVREAKAEAK